MGKQALEGSRFNGFMVDPDKVKIIGLDTDDGPEHPLWDERAKKPVDPSMVNNVIAFGVKQPIGVTKKNGEVIVVYGRQRVKWTRAANEALRAAGKEPLQVPATLDKGEDVDLTGDMITENEGREDDDILTKAEKAKRFMSMKRTDGTQINIEDCALRFGVTDRAIRQWLAILELSPKVKKAVKDGKLTATAASKLQGKTVEEQDEMLDELMSEAESKGKTKVSTSEVKKKSKGGAGPSRKMIVAMSEVAPSPYCTVLGWVLGEVDDSSFLTECPAIANALDKAMKKSSGDKEEAKPKKKKKAEK